MHAGTFVALIIGLLEGFELPSRASRAQATTPVLERQNGNEHSEEDNENSTEATPLLQRDRRIPIKSDIDEDNQIGLWLLQFLVAVPFPVILITQAAIMLINGANQTLVDGSSPDLGIR